MLSPDQIHQYREQGYVIPDYRLSTDTIEDIKLAHHRLIERSPQFSDYCGALLIEDLSFLNYARDQNILDMVSQLIGPDIALWNSSFFAKPAKIGTRTPWHQDGEYWPITPLATCTVWIALDDATISNGCLKFLPGSHKDKRLESHHLNNSDDIALPLELDHRHVDESKAEAIELEAGQISLHDVFLMHASEANRSNQPRRGMTLRYMPTSSVYRRDLNKSPQDTKRPVFLVRGIDQSGKNDFTLR